MISKLLAQLIKRKFATGIALVLIVGVGYFGYGKIFGNDGAIRYATAQVQKGTLIVSISGTGQVSVSNQVDLKPKASGDIVYIGVKNGQEVKAGTLIAQLDARDAQKAVRDAEVNLESARIALEKLKGPEDLATPKNKTQAEENLKKSYDDGFNTVANAFLDMPTVMVGLQNVLFGLDFNTGQQNLYYYSDAVKSYDEKVNQYRDDAYTTYQMARKAYDQNFANYKSISRFSDEATIEKLINQTYDTTKSIAEAVKNANNFVQFYQDKLTERNLKPQPLSATHISNLIAYTGTTNAHLLNLLGIINSIKNYMDALLNAGLDVRSQELAVQQRENALRDAQEKLADYYVRAPFDGVIAQTDMRKGDSVSAASVLAFLITRQKLAEISLNEVDVAQIKVGQKATLTFDAVSDLTITGQIAEVDAVGTVSQGVVTYTVKIGFDTQDERIKPGMSVSAAIVTDAKPNALLVPNSAVKSQGGISYVEIVEGDDRAVALAANGSGAILRNSPRRQNIEVGAANDEFTEIISGISEGDAIVTRTIQPTANQPTQQQSGGLRIPGLPGGGGGGGGFRGGGGGGGGGGEFGH